MDAMSLMANWFLFIQLPVALLSMIYLLSIYIRIFRLRFHGCQLMLRFGETQDIDDVNQAIATFEAAIKLAHQNLQPPLLNLLGASLHRRFILSGDLDDVSYSIFVFLKAIHVHLGRPEVPVPVMISNLALSHMHFFQRTNSLWHLDAAISAYRDAVDNAPEKQGGNSVDLPELLSKLGMALRMRYEHTGEPQDIGEAISLQRRAVQITPDGHPAIAIRLNLLGRSLRSRFQVTFNLHDLAHAVSAQRRAVEITSDGHADLPRLLADLGWTLCIRATQAADFDDVGEAIALHRRAVQTTPENDKDLVSWLNMLGESLRLRFETTGELGDITEAIAAQQRAVDLIPSGGANLPRHLGNLGVSLYLRSMHTRNPHDSDQSISTLQRAIEATSGNHLETGKWFQVLGSSFHQRFYRTGDMTDINEAISAGQKAVELTPNGHERRTACLVDLAMSLYSRAYKSGNIVDFQSSISRLEESATGGYGAPRDRLVAAKLWVRVLRHHYPDSLDSIRAYDALLSIIPVIAGPEQTISRRFAQLEAASEYGGPMQLLYARHENAPSGSVQEAAAVACQLGRPEKALEWLEEGRCLVWRQLNNLRAPIDELTIRDGDLAQKFKDVSRRLDVSGLSWGPAYTEGESSKKISVEDQTLAHASLATEWNNILKEIRCLPGFEYFLQPLPCTTLMQHLPATGQIVVVNVDQRRCDAIALLRSRGEPFHIPLPLFSLEKAKKYRSELRDGLARGGLRVRESVESTRAIGKYKGKKTQRLDTVRKVLGSLWVELVKPILDALEISKSGDILPRIWWCPTGLATFLPIHAAGIYDVEEPESLSDYAISSYTPTVHALTSRANSDHPIDDGSRGLFLTCQPNGILRSPIVGTIAEVTSISNKAKEHGVRALKLEGDEVSIDECLKYMEEYSGVHLACHATQNAAKPLQSRFLFHKGSLPLSKILQRNLPNADFAFLSACQTSSGEERLSDEAVHLAAGMLAAGYRRVVATMWAIGDRHAQVVATDFYEYLWSHRKDGSGSGFDGSLSAEALHYAVQNLKQNIGYSEEALLAWIPFVHFGH